MSKTRKAPGSVGALSRAGEVTAGSTSISTCNYTASPGQLSIADCLGRDRETARTARELCAALNIDNRTLRQRIEAERRAGALIVADNASGYWVTDDPAEAQVFARSMQHRAREILRTARAIERAAGLD